MSDYSESINLIHKMMKFSIPPVLLLLMTLSALSCKKEVQSPPIPGGTSFEAVIANGGEFESFSPKSDSTLLDSTIVEENGVRWACVTKEYDFVSGGDEYFNFNPSSEIIWPGNLLQGNSITEATPNPIVVERGAGCVTIDLVNGSSGTQKCMDKVSNGNIIQSPTLKF